MPFRDSGLLQKPLDTRQNTLHYQDHQPLHTPHLLPATLAHDQPRLEVDEEPGLAIKVQTRDRTDEMSAAACQWKEGTWLLRECRCEVLHMLHHAYGLSM